MKMYECEKCDGTGLDLSYVDKMKNVVNRNNIPACEVCEGWGEIETKMYNQLKKEIKTLNSFITLSNNPRSGTNDKFYRLADAVNNEDHPQHYIYKAIQDAHGEMLPCDFIYEHVSDVLTNLDYYIRDKDNHEIDDIDIESELVESYLDWHQPTGYELSNYGLTLWLGAGGGYRYELVDDVIAEQGITSITEALECAYQREKAQTEYTIVQSIANHLAQ